MADSKSDYAHEERTIKEVEGIPVHPTHTGVPQEAEPTTRYSAGWKTFAAVIALSLANCCAVVTNTTNTTIKFQVMTVGDPALASWIANGNFLVVVAFGPIFVSVPRPRQSPTPINKPRVRLVIASERNGSSLVDASLA
jgi:hypothetical protein